MEINIAYLNDILVYMIEAQYWDNPSVSDYRGFIAEYKERAERIRELERHQAFKEGLKHTLKGLLNNPHLDYESIIVGGAMHGMGSQEKAKELLELIWHQFYGDEVWRDDGFTNGNLSIADRQFEA